MAVQGTVVLDPNTQLEDIFWEIYHWLDGHPTETVLVSLKVDNSDNTAELKQKVYNLITGDNVKYWVQSTLVCRSRIYLIPPWTNNVSATDSRSHLPQSYFH